MTDLSYTNKDGLNPAAGFINVYNYHKDGASEGEGYATGGYPEVTGETSPFPSKNYKTGDNPDFFDNGNAWEQEQPELTPSTEGDNDDSGNDDTGKLLTISGTFVNDDAVKGPAVSSEDFAILIDNDGKLANVSYNGTTYQAMVSYNENDDGIDFYFNGDDNLGIYLWLYAEDGSEDTAKYLWAAKENGTVGEEEFTISINLENFTEEESGGGDDTGR